MTRDVLALCALLGFVATGTSTLSTMTSLGWDTGHIHITRDATSQAFRTAFEAAPTTGAVASLAQLRDTSWHQGNRDVCLFRHERSVDLHTLAQFATPAYLGGSEVNQLFSSLVSHCSTAHRVVYRHEQEVAGLPCTVGHACETVVLGRDPSGTPRALDTELCSRIRHSWALPPHCTAALQIVILNALVTGPVIWRRKPGRGTVGDTGQIGVMARMIYNWDITYSARPLRPSITVRTSRFNPTAHAAPRLLVYLTNAISAMSFVTSCIIERFADWVPRSHRAILGQHAALRETQRLGARDPRVHFTHCQYGPLRTRCRLSGFGDLVGPFARAEAHLSHLTWADKVLQVEYVLAYSG